MSNRVTPENPLVFWANQHGCGVTVHDSLYLLFARAARASGKTVEEWFNDMLRDQVEKVLAEVEGGCAMTPAALGVGDE